MMACAAQYFIVCALYVCISLSPIIVRYKGFAHPFGIKIGYPTIHWMGPKWAFQRSINWFRVLLRSIQYFTSLLQNWSFPATSAFRNYRVREKSAVTRLIPLYTTILGLKDQFPDEYCYEEAKLKYIPLCIKLLRTFAKLREVPLSLIKVNRRVAGNSKELNLISL